MRISIKSFFPRSLFGRAALILVVPIVMIQLVVSLIFIQRHFEGVTRQMTRSVLIEINYLLDVAAQTSGPIAQSKVAELAASLQIGIGPPDANFPAQDRRSYWDWSGREVIATLRQGLPGIAAVDLSDPENAVRILLPQAKGDLMVTVARERVSASNPHQLLVIMMAASILLTVISYIFLRNQLSPITRLALAAEAFGKGRNVPYRLRGATEVRAAGAAFLDMRARIERQIEQRTLLLSGVSHDLRTPLTRLKLGLAFLPEDEETAALKADVVQMERLVNEFLAFTRGDAMEEPQPCDPAALVRHVIENARRAGQEVRAGDIEVARMPIRIRPQAIERALDNLIGNAVRFGSFAEVSLELTDRVARIVVEDDGPGIPAEQREEAVVPFIRLDEARDPNRGGGVGLGLSIAADIARSHGGALRLGQSKKYGGLRAELTLAR
mgnify:CR=1 FL=1